MVIIPKANYSNSENWLFFATDLPINKYCWQYLFQRCEELLSMLQILNWAVYQYLESTTIIID